MAITSVKRLWSGRGGSDTLLKRRTYREQWEVLTDSTEETEQTVGNATGLPVIGAQHPQDAIAIVVGVEASQSEDTPYIWYVTLTYDSKPDFPNSTNPDGNPLDPKDVPENPLLRPAVWKIDFSATSEAATEWRAVDAGGNLAANFTAIRNSAKLPFDPPLMIEVSRPTIRVTKNVPVVTFPFLLSLENAVNDRAWRGVPKWCARVSGVSAGNKYENGVAFVELSVDIALKNETWLSQLLDAGFFELTTRTDELTGLQVQKWTKARDPFGAEATEPQPLDGAGRVLAPNAAPVFLRGLPKNYHLENFALLFNW